MKSPTLQSGASVLILGAVLAMTGTACSSSASDTSENDQKFVATVSERVSGSSPDELVTRGQGVCSQLESGSDPVDVYLATMAAGFNPEEAQALMVGAAVYYCPSFEQEVVVSLYSFNTQ